MKNKCCASSSPQLPSEPLYHPVLCRQVHLCSQQCCNCALLPRYYKRSDMLSEPHTCLPGNECLRFWDVLGVCAGNVLLSAIFLALATYQSIYPLSLCAPALLYFMQVRRTSCSVFFLRVPLDFPAFVWFLPSVSTSQSTTDGPVSGGSSRSTPSSTWAASSSSSASPSSCWARGTTCSLSTASCEGTFTSWLSF